MIRIKKLEDQTLIDQGVILIYNGVPYTEQGILDGHCPLNALVNGTLCRMGYKHTLDGKWEKNL